MQFLDAVTISGSRRTSDGYLVAEVRTARTGIQIYAGSEVGKPEHAQVRVYRPADQVFSKDSLASYAHKPVTNDHPQEAVTADNWKLLSVGTIGDEVARDGEFVRVPLIVMDAATIQAITEGKRELSAGYVCDLSFETGVSPDGEPYDAIQKDIRINHVAIVQHGRAGSKARIGDADHWGACPVSTHHEKESPMADLRKVLVDGLQVETTDAGAAAIDRLTQDKATLADRLTGLETTHATAIAAKDADLAKKDAEIDALKAKVLSDADIDKRVADRAALIAAANIIVKDIKTDGLSDAAIRKAVVVAKLGDAVAAGKSDVYIDARFDILADEAKATPDPVRDALLQRDGKADNSVNEAYEQMVKDMQSAHLPAKAQ